MRQIFPPFSRAEIGCRVLFQWLIWTWLKILYLHDIDEAMKKLTQHSAQKFMVGFGLLTLAVASSSANAGCKPFTVYTKNIQRAIAQNGADGPLGDMVIANGLVYERPIEGSEPIGTFDLSAITTSVNGATERRQVFREVSFNQSFKDKLNQINRRCGTSKNRVDISVSPTNDLNISGVETYPSGGGILSDPAVFSITSGTGIFVGARGQVKISHDSASQFFTYTFTLLPR